LHFAYYNFVKRHNTLRCTPAMAAGVTSTFWSVGELLEAVAMNQKLPDNFNWVSVRAECSPTAAFLKLRSQVEQDINDRIKLMPEEELPRYSLHFSSRRGVEILGLSESSGTRQSVLIHPQSAWS